MVASPKKTDYGKIVRLQIPSHPKELFLARNLIQNLALSQGFSVSKAVDLKIASGEILSNIVRHAYKGEDFHPIFIEIKWETDRMEIRFRDLGRKAKPSKLKSTNLNDYRESGLGLFLIKHLTDHFYLEETEKPGNETVLIKKK